MPERSRVSLIKLLLCLSMLVSVPATGAATEKHNVPYSALLELAVTEVDALIQYGDDPLQVMYQYGNLSKQRNAVVFVHGGCWLNAYDIEHSKGWMSELSARGLTVFGIEYRRTGDNGGGWPGSRDDIVAAMDTLHQQFTNAGYPAKVLVSGHSAGGHLALLASGATRLQIDRVIGLAAITDVVRYAQGENSCQQATPAFMGGAPDTVPAAYQEAQPILTQRHANTVLMQGTADAIVPVSQSVLAGSEQVLIRDAGHFDWLHPQSVAFKEFLKQVKQ